MACVPLPSLSCVPHVETPDVEEGQQEAGEHLLQTRATHDDRRAAAATVYLPWPASFPPSLRVPHF